LPFNDFLLSQDSHSLRDLTAGPRRGSTALRKPRVRRFSKTRMNTRVLRNPDGRKRAVTLALTRVAVL
jgi:hypothetical protein